MMSIMGLPTWLVVCLLLFHISTVTAQQSYSYPNGQLTPLNLNCGSCPAGTQRQSVNGPYCGPCVAQTQSCASGFYWNNGCRQCPCPGTGGRQFGVSCRVENSAVVCDCPPEYTGPDCGQCAPGAAQSNQYPYNCVSYNTTNTFQSNCAAGNRCNPTPPQTVIQRPPPPQCGLQQTGCQQTSCQQTGCQTTQCQQTSCQTQCQTGGCSTNPCNPGAVNVTCPGTGCPGPNGCPGVGCPGTGCPGGCTTPGGCTSNGCGTQCGTSGCVSTNCNTSVCTGNNCNGNGCVGNGCNGNGCVGNICNGNGCTTNGCTGNGCTTNGCTGNGCNGCNNNGCNSCNNQPGCGVVIGPCPNPCPSPCAPCATIPSCPDCVCPQCPAPPPCICEGGGSCNKCPDVCAPCPDTCQKCPDLSCPGCPAIPPCPQCPNCTITPPPGIVIEELCLCDPRGTVQQLNNQCSCKVNVQGAHCDTCKPGYFGLSSTRSEGCISCFCSGLSASCSLTPYYRAIIKTDRSKTCSVELTDDNHSVVYTTGSNGFSFDGNLAQFNKAKGKLFWSLPSCMKGDRVTSYGGILSFSRMCSGSGNEAGADHEVIIVGGSGATIYWTTFEPQKCDGKWSKVDVILSERAYWSSWKGEQYRRAARPDIMEVLADIQLILVRATFVTNPMTVSIKDVTLSTVSHQRTDEGIALEVESCLCPTGYRGLSCQNCEPGYYRDPSDMSRSVFGACKPCPCGKTAEGCHMSGGQVICKCRDGFTGPLCQDREVISVTCDPFRIREVEGTDVDFTCGFTTNSKRALLLRLSKDGESSKAEEVTTLTKTFKLLKNMNRVVCEVIDRAGVTWAVVYCSVDIVPQAIMVRPPPPRLLVLIPKETFICVWEGEKVTLTCDQHYFGVQKIAIEWRKDSDSKVISTGPNNIFNNVRPEDAGTYICSSSDGSVTGAGQIALMVRRREVRMLDQYPYSGTSDIEAKIHQRHGGDFPFYPIQRDLPQADQPDQQSGQTSPEPVIAPLPNGHPKVVVDPPRVVAKSGDTVIIRCNATGDEPLKFYWKSGSNDYIPSHVRLSHGALIFRNFRSQDAGDYFCIAYNSLGQSSAKVSIIHADTVTPSTEPTPLQKPRIEILHSEIVARLGENVNYQCRSNQTGVLKYAWSRLGGNMPNSSEIRPNGLLTLYRVREADKGTYICTVVNENGVANSAQAVLQVKSNVMIKPTLTITPKSPLRARTGESVRLDCEGVGTPTPNVTWVRSIDGTERKLVSSASNKASYQIRQMSAADVGKYKCIVVSDAGSGSESLSLVLDNGKQCKESEFRCKSGDQCIPRDDRCDNERDCKDGSDEENCKGSKRARRNAKF